MTILRKLENIFSAVAFAEAGEHETARQILKENERDAESDETQTARAKKHERVSHSPAKA